MDCATCFIFITSFNLHSELIATRHLEKVVYAHHPHLLTIQSLFNPLQTGFCHPNSAETALSKSTHNFPIAETGYTFSILNSTPSLPFFRKITLFGFPPVSNVFGFFSASLKVTSSPPQLLNVGMPQSSFFSLLFLSLYIPLEDS